MASSLTTELNRPAAQNGGRAPQNQSRRTMLMGCPVDLLTTEVLLTELAHAIDTQSGPKIIQFINGNKIAQVRQSPDMGQIMWRANYALVDGQPLLPMGRMLGVRIPERIDGVGLMAKLINLAHERRYSIFLLGAKQAVIDTCV